MCDENGVLIDGLMMSGANQEHGIVSWRAGAVETNAAAMKHRFAVGTRLRVLPNHACATAAQFSAYTVLKTDGSLQEWPRFSGW